MTDTPDNLTGYETLVGTVRIARTALQFTAIRGKGPGGQAVNKLATAVQLRVAIADIQGLRPPARERLRKLAGQRLVGEDELMIQAYTHRSQIDNRRACVDRLRSLVAEAVIEPKVRKKKRPSRAMIQRRLDAKRRQSRKKQQRRESRRPEH